MRTLPVLLLCVCWPLLWACPTCTDYFRTNAHPMKYFCDSKYALKVKVISLSGTTFRAEVKSDYKRGDGRSIIGSTIDIYTDCADYFILKKVYFITAHSGDFYGGTTTLNMDSCDFISLPKELPCTQRYGFQGDYDCRCKDDCVPKDSNPLKVTCFNKYARCEKYRGLDYKHCARVYHSVLYRACLDGY